ncbi:MAG: MFS transporter [Bacteroidia bacterium]
MLSIIREYKKIDKSMLHVITVAFFVQLINVSFISILPLYMKAEGYSDATYAHYTSYRYLGMLALALLMAIYIKGRRILPLFYIAALGVPLFALLILIGVQYKVTSLIVASHLLWGTAYTFIQIPVLPYIMRNASKEQLTLTISLNYATWSIANIVSGFIIALLNGINSSIFNECTILYIITLGSFSTVYFISKINKKEHIPVQTEKSVNLKDYDWKIIIKALVPTTMLAIGAGFTIPFISLFFSSVHNMSTATFSAMNFFTAILVTLSAMYVPSIKEKFGYSKAVPYTQLLAIVAMLIMATTQYYNVFFISAIIAALFYIIRQPLMSLAVPMTTEITMKYVGERNREMVSGLISAVWSGAYYFSAIGFGILRHMEVEYVNIFWITAAMYLIGVFLYILLIREYDQMEHKEKMHPKIGMHF